MQDICVLPGRIRFKASNLYYNKELSQYIDKYINSLYGVKYCMVNFSTTSILIIYDIKKTSYDLLKQNIENALSSPINKSNTEFLRFEDYFNAIEKKNNSKKKFLFWGLTYIIYKLKYSFFGKFSINRNLQVLQVASIVTIIGGYPILKRLYRKFARSMPTDADILLQLTAISFTLIRESSKGIFVLLLKAFNEYIKFSAEVESRRMLLDSSGKTFNMAWILSESGQEVLVPIDSLNTGDMIVVHEGEVVPVEGNVTEGGAIINSLYYTGQPIVSSVSEGTKIYEGTIIVSGKIKLSVTSMPETIYKEDIKLESMEIHKRASWYQENIAPISIGSAALNYVLSGSISNALAVLLVLSPGATAVAVSSGIKNYISLLSKNRVYIRNPNTFESIVNTDRIVFDKTGTLTYGRMKIISVESFDKDYSKGSLISICAACEVGNYHPISVTLQEEVVDNYDISKVQSSVLLPSKGISSVYDNKRVLIGSRTFMEENRIDMSIGIDKYHHYEEQLMTPVFVAIDGELSGIIIMQDILREDAPELISKLKYRGLKDITLLTGDNTHIANNTAQRLGINKVYGNQNYKDKAAIILDYKTQGNVMMVGDGVNDVLAMKAANVSVSYANSSCDKIKLHSDVIIFEDYLTKLPDLITISQKSYYAIRRTIFISNLYNIFLGTLAFTGVINIFAAKSLNTMNSLLVLLLNQRIQLITPRKIYSHYYDDIANKNIR